MSRRVPTKLAYFSQSLNPLREGRSSLQPLLKKGKDAELATTLNNVGILDRH